MLSASPLWAQNPEAATSTSETALSEVALWVTGAGMEAAPMEWRVGEHAVIAMSIKPIAKNWTSFFIFHSL